MEMLNPAIDDIVVYEKDFKRDRHQPGADQHHDDARQNLELGSRRI